MTRRDLLRLAAAGVCTTSASGWLPVLAARAAQTASEGTPHKSCILLWMSGGPSHLDTFDLKPDALDGGEFRPISTSAPGVGISEHFPKLALLTHHGAIIRSMSTGEADHGRAGILMHTGFRPTSSGLKHPTVGALVSAEIGEPGSLLPNFVVCGQGNRVDPGAAGYLGPAHEGLVVLDAAKGLADLRSTLPDVDFQDRVELLTRLQHADRSPQRSAAGIAQRTTYDRALGLMRSDKARAFDLFLEPSASADRYGGSDFGKGCLLARRLVEAGVAFVEVVLPGWDTHQDNSARTRDLCEIVDPAMSSLIDDLDDRGLLENTLVVWMGEFGRTPRINNMGGRDHYARAWSTVLAGGGIHGGQVIGRTDKDGAQVEDRPVTVADFMATLCVLLGIDFNKTRETPPPGRPVRIVAEGAEPIRELLI
jgi:hypothetical protein